MSITPNCLAYTWKSILVILIIASGSLVSCSVNSNLEEFPIPTPDRFYGMIDTQKPFVTSSESDIPTKANISSSTKSSLVPTVQGTREPGIISSSPNRQWVAKRSYCYLLIQNTVNNTKWEIITSDLLFDCKRNLVPLQWSTENGLLYLTIHYWVDGYETYYVDSGLFKMDLKNGAIETIFEPPNDKNTILTNYSISPNDRYIAYWPQGPYYNMLRIHDILSQEDREMVFSSQYAGGGHIKWSASGENLILTMLKYNENSQQKTWSIILVNLRDFSHKVLIPNSRSAIIPVQWEDNSHVLVEKVEDQSNRIYYSLDIHDASLTPRINPTETVISH